MHAPHQRRQVGHRGALRRIDAGIDLTQMNIAARRRLHCLVQSSRLDGATRLTHD